MRLPLLAATLAALGGVAACAPVPAGDGATTSGPGPCFYASQVRNFRTDRADTLYVRAARDGVYRLDTFGGCPDLDGAVALSLVRRFGGTDRLCGGDQVQVVINQPSPTFSAPCYARVTELVTPEELEALPERVRP